MLAYTEGRCMNRQEELTQLILGKITARAAALREQWRRPQATPTRHFVIDELLPSDLCRDIYLAFPRDGAGFFSRRSFREKKKTSATLDDYDSILADVTYATQDRRVVNAVATICEFEQIEPDPQLYAGGLSMMFPGDFLNPHIDNSHDANRGRYRRLNLLYYVSPDWKLENGGNFELWDDMVSTPKTIVAATNRLVVMETNNKSWHSVSKVLVQRPRCCVSNYYFSAISPNATRYFHVTSFIGRPEQRLRRLLGPVDNLVRNAVSGVLKVGRGKRRVNRSRAPS
jgi:Rps23 Pro-64 3,4-dihydroxylase Tpa1-like proline 4-hydroxylase